MENESLRALSLEALIATPDMSEQNLADKLYEISAENFGNEFMSFTLMPLSQITLNMSYMMDSLSLSAFKNDSLSNLNRLLQAQ